MDSGLISDRMEEPVTVAQKRYEQCHDSRIVNEFTDDDSVVFKVKCENYDTVYSLAADALDELTTIAQADDDLFYIEVRQETVTVYEATFDYSNTHANVLAANEREAHENAQDYIEQQKQDIMAQLDTHLGGPVRGTSTSVSVREIDDTHYEIDRDGRWNEGEL